MILIITNKQDFTADFVIDKLNNRNIPYRRFNCEDISRTSYSFGSFNEYEFELHKITTFESIWFRRTKLPDIDISNKSEKLYILNEYQSLLTNLFQVVKTKKWLSNPGDVYRAENKLYQLQVAAMLKFKIPDTIVTNNRKDITSFYYKHKKNIVIKPLFFSRISYPGKVNFIYTNKVKEEHITNLKKYELTPAIFQEYIEKEYELRVTVVDGEVFSAKVDSQSNLITQIDWRKERLKFEKCTIPKELKAKCVKLVNDLGLSFGAIDIIKNKDGDYFFLEINPNGQWAWIEFDTGLTISDKIIEFLTI